MEAFAAALLDVKKSITRCPICCNLTDVTPCRICQDEQREQAVLCIVEDSQDVLAIEKTHEYKGLYHVLQGRISPMDGKGPEDLTIKELLERLKDETVKEVILTLIRTSKGNHRVIPFENNCPPWFENYPDCAWGSGRGRLGIC